MFRLHRYIIPLSLLVAFGSCEKESLIDTAPEATGALRVGAASCTAFSYSDTLFYLREQRTDYVVSPLRSVTGTYGASPAGLQINSSTGAINVSKSETGLRYRVYYVKAGTKDTCSRYITISGIDYLSSMHVLSRNDTVIKPLYNARPVFAMPCVNGSGGGTPKSNVSQTGCEFDDGDDDDDNDGYDDEPEFGKQLRASGVDIHPLNAIINLKRTVRNGVFGAKPSNGASRTYRLYYRIADASNRALNHIDIKLVYYNRTSDVPASLMNQVKTQGARKGAPAPQTALPVAYSEDGRPVRPPIIIIVGS